MSNYIVKYKHSREEELVENVRKIDTNGDYVLFINYGNEIVKGIDKDSLDRFTKVEVEDKEETKPYDSIVVQTVLDGKVISETINIIGD